LLFCVAQQMKEIVDIKKLHMATGNSRCMPRGSGIREKNL